MAYNVFISDKYTAQGLELLKSVKGLKVIYEPGLKPEELTPKLADVHGLIVRSATKVTAQVIDAAPKLKAIGRAGSGVDNIDVPYATKRGIVVMNTPGGNTVTTAEHALALLFSLARKIPQAHRDLAQGRWEKSKWTGIELTGKVLGVIGLGAIGSVVAQRAAALKLEVIAVDPFVSKARAAELGVRLVEMDELLRTSDIVTVHVPKSKETASLIDAAAIAKMKRGVRIINCARGGIVNERDLLEGLQSGKVAGAALDVYESEPLSASPLFGRDDVVVTPHLGASTVEAQDKVALAIAEQMRDLLLQGVVRHAVNMPELPPEMHDAVAPYQRLAGKLGSLLGQLGARDPRQLEIGFRGAVAALPHGTIVRALLCGLLGQTVEDVNEINALSLAADRGIRLIESSEAEQRDHSNLIKVTLQHAGGRISLAGTKRETGELRLVNFNGYPVDIEPSGHMLIIVNDDKPGVLGSISSLLGRRGINIATVQLGRLKAGGSAATLIVIDQPLQARQLADLLKLKNVSAAQQVVL